MAQQRPGTAVPRKPSPAVYRRRRLAAAIIVLLLIGLLVAAGFFIASLFGAGSTEGAAQADSGKTAAQEQKAQSGSGGKDRAAKTDSSAQKDDDDGNTSGGDGAKEAGDSKHSADDSGSEQEAKTAESAEEAEVEPSPEATEPATCEDSDIQLEASTDKTVYPPDVNPVLTMSVSNEGDEKCGINLGTSQMEFLITSGQDRIFSSTDCQVDAVDNLQVLKSGETEKAKLTWERNRTAPDCVPVESEPLPGTYMLVTKLGDLTSEEVSFRLE